MPRPDVKAGSTSVVLGTIFVQDSTKTDGSGLTGLVNNTTGLTCYYKRNKGTASVAATMNSITTLGTFAGDATHAAFKEIDATNMPGSYEFHGPDNAFASGAEEVTFYLRGAASMAPCVFKVQLTAWDNQDGVHGGLSCLPNTAVTTNASLLTSGTGTDQLSVTSGRVDIGKVVGNTQTADANGLLKVDVEDYGGAAGTFAGGRPEVNTTKWLGGTIPAVNVTGVPLVDLKYTLGTISPAAAGYVGIDWGQVTNKTTTNALTGTTIATSQVVASVTGAVGSVTAAVTLSAGDSPVIATGTATAGTANTITLQTALGADNLVNGCKIKITSGTGASQERVISGYVDSTKVVTVGHNWTTNPNATSVYAVLYDDAPKIDSNLKVSGVVLVDTITTYTGDTPQTGDCFARLGAPAGASIAADLAEIEGETDTLIAGVTVTTNNDKTGYSLSQTFPSNFSALAITAGGAVTAGTVSDKTGYSLAGNVTVGGYAAGQDPYTLLMTVAMTEGYTTGAPTMQQAMFELLQTVGQFSIAGTTVTAQKRDKTTAAATWTLNDGTNPTSRTRAT